MAYAPNYSGILLKLNREVSLLAVSVFRLVALVVSA